MGGRRYGGPTQPFGPSGGRIGRVIPAPSRLASRGRARPLGLRVVLPFLKLILARHLQVPLSITVKMSRLPVWKKKKNQATIFFLDVLHFLSDVLENIFALAYLHADGFFTIKEAEAKNVNTDKTIAILLFT